MEMKTVSRMLSPAETEVIPKEKDTARYPRQMGIPCKIPLRKNDFFILTALFVTLAAQVGGERFLFFFVVRDGVNDNGKPLDAVFAHFRDDNVEVAIGKGVALVGARYETNGERDEPLY